MRSSFSIALVLLCTVSLSAQSSDRVPVEGGDIAFTPIIHASVQIEHAGIVIQVDPWSASDLSGATPADLVLVTDSPSHHLVPAAIAPDIQDTPATIRAF